MTESKPTVGWRLAFVICCVCLFNLQFFQRIFHFLRLKFDRDPLVTLPLKSNFRLLNIFTRLDDLKNAIHVKDVFDWSKVINWRVDFGYCLKTIIYPKESNDKRTHHT